MFAEQEIKEKMDARVEEFLSDMSMIAINMSYEGYVMPEKARVEDFKKFTKAVEAAANDLLPTDN